MNIETIRDDVRRVVAKAGFLSADEVTDAVLDLIRAELTGDEVVEAVAQTIARGRRGADAKVNDTDRFAANVALATVVTALGGE